MPMTLLLKPYGPVVWLLVSSRCCSNLVLNIYSNNFARGFSRDIGLKFLIQMLQQLLRIYLENCSIVDICELLDHFR